MAEGDTFGVEQLYYVVRIPAILLVTVIAAIILATSVPELNESLVRADTLAASIAYDQQLFESPGVITSSTWQSYTYETISYQSSALNQLPAARITLQVEGNEDQVKYTNREHFRALDVQGRVASVTSYEVSLPITYKNQDLSKLGKLIIEVNVPR